MNSTVVAGHVKRLLRGCDQIETVDEALNEMRWMLQKLRPNDTGLGHAFAAETGSEQVRSVNRTRLRLLRHAWSSLDPRECGVAATWIAQRAANKPLQYILGTLPFAGLDLRTRRPTLIPRWETEEWAMTVVSKLAGNNSHGNEPINVIDLCTGSGCIGLSLAHHIPSVRILALDNSRSAVKLASLNARRNGLERRVAVRELDLFRHSDPVHAAENIETMFKDAFKMASNDDSNKPFIHYIVSNPPYIPLQEYMHLEQSVINWEDRAALLGVDEDGAGFYRRIAQLAQVLLVPSPAGKETERIFLEINGAGQVQAVKAALVKSGFVSSDVWKDLAGNDRVVTGAK
ncbi:S-adenosyl-L-methionine-dependent methyltransferase [Chytriomyces cf. hyalinus JEL632]|nr:S-adenosyl-L-methionine-dependent methyltransferase [Chytriomyces cf. hyalinus JEL632]